MRYIKQYISCEEVFLEVTVLDDDDISNLSQYQEEKNIMISLSDLQYLSNFFQVERLIITSGEAPKNFSEFLEMQKNLKELKLDFDETEPFTKWCVDVSKLSNLEYLFSRSSYNFKGISNSKSLKTLVVNKWYNENLIQLKHSSIDTLSIGNGVLRSLSGIEDMPLKILSLSNLSKLTDISIVQNLPLQILELDNCNHIACLEDISSDTLEYLMIYGKNKIYSGSFIKKFKQIKRIILGVVIEDGDLSVFDTLDSAILLTNCRHYNRNNSQLPKSACQYSIFSIPQWRYIYSNRHI